MSTSQRQRYTLPSGLLVLLLFSSVCYGGDFSFRGIPLGKTVVESGIPQCGKHAANTTCYEQNDNEKFNNMYSFRNLPDIGINGQTQVETKDGVMTKLYFQFKSYDTVELAKIIEQKYGTPKTSATKVQNKLGASFDNIQFTWKSKGYEIKLSHYGLSLNDGLLTIDEPTARGKLSKKEQESLEKAKNNL